MTVNGYNADITEEQRQRLREIFPEVFNEGKVNFEKLRGTLGDVVDRDSERYGLNWRGKSNVFAKIQEKTVSTLHPQPEESIDWDTTQNMFIEGDNLEALKVLHKAYYGKIKMIYIDPPYNTGNDFVYNDDFKKTCREQAFEENRIDEEGFTTRDDGLRPNNGGHKHSNWLDMMYPRLFLARNLLRQDGVIFVSIDDNEVHNLRLMMNEIFGEENFVAQVIIKSNPRGRQSDRTFATMHEYLLVYARNNSEADIKGHSLTSEQTAEYKYTDNNGEKYRLLGLRQRGVASLRTDRPDMFYPLYVDPTKLTISTEKTKNSIEVLPKKSNGVEGRWMWGKVKTARDINLLVPKLISGRNEWDIFVRDYLEKDGAERTRKSKTIWDEKKLNYQNGTVEVKQLFNGAAYFDYPKPIELMKRVIELTTYDDDIVLDFFSGSSTAAHAVNQRNAEDYGNRKWIMVQLPELTDKKSEAYKAGYKTIIGISRERIRRASAKISTAFAVQIAKRKSPLDLGFRSYVIGDSNFKKWNELVSDPEEIKQQTLDSLNLLEDGVTDDDLLTEILLKRGASPLAEIETHDGFVLIPSGNLAISFSRHMTEKLFAQILAKSPSQIILLDQAFRDDVNLKTNLILQAEKNNIAVEVL